MNTYSKLRTSVLVLALVPLVSVACDEGPLEVEPIQEVKAIAPEARVVLRPNRVTLHPGEVFKLEAVLLEGRHEDHLFDVDLEWNSSDPDVLIPLGDGFIQALAIGEVTVEADHRNWTAQAFVQVVHPKEPAIGRGQ